MSYLDHDGLAYFWGKVKAKLGALAWKSTVAKSDLAQAVQTSLGKADSALQSYTESDPTVPSWAKAANKPSYTYSEVGAAAASHTHTKSQITDFPASSIDPTDPATEGYVKLGVLTTKSQSFTVPAIPSELLIVAKNISGSDAPTVVFDDDSDNCRVVMGVLRKPTYSGSTSYSVFSFRKSLRLAGLYTYNGGDDGGIYAHVGVSSTSQAWSAELHTFQIEATFKAKLYNTLSRGTMELWYRR